MNNLILRKENLVALKKEGNRLAANEANGNPNPPKIEALPLGQGLNKKKPIAIKKAYVKILPSPSFTAPNQKGAKSNSFKAKTEGAKVKRVLSLSQILAYIRQRGQKKSDRKKSQKLIEPLIPPKSLIIILKDTPQKAVYNERIINYKHCGLLQQYIGLGGKILPRRQTRLTAKQQRFVAKTIKSARIMGLLPFVSKERGFFM